MVSRANKENRKEYDQLRFNKRWQRWRDLIWPLKDNPCTDCGGRFHPAAMQFDHLRDKTYRVSKMYSYSKERILEEISKCELVCANCHAVRTFNRAEQKARK